MKKVFAIAMFLLSFGAFNAQAQSNPQNEFDYVGKIHNEVLLKFIQKNSGKKLSISQVLEEVKATTLANADYSARFGTQAIQITEDQAREIAIDYPNQFKNIIGTLSITNDAKTKLNELLSIISNAQKNNSSYTDIYNKIVAYEIKVKISDLSKIEKEIIFSASSTARYSTKMWLGETNSPNAKLIGIIFCDIVGAGICGSIGALFGAGIPAAIMGGIAASGMAGIGDK